MRPVTIAIGGALAGAALAAVGLALAPNADGSVADDATSTTLSQQPPEATGRFWVDPHETLLSSAVVIPEALFVEGGEAVLTYRVESIAPPSNGLLFEGDDPTGVSPEVWTLVTPDGEYSGTAANFDSRQVRIPIDDDFLLGRITEIRIDRHRLRLPYHYLIEVPPVAGETVQLDDGRYLVVRRILPQSTSVIVHLDLNTELDPFDDPPTNLNFGFANVDTGGIFITGQGPEWISNSVRQFEGYQLIREGPDVPNPMVFRVRSTYSTVVGTPVTVDMGGLVLG